MSIEYCLHYLLSLVIIFAVQAVSGHGRGGRGTRGTHAVLRLVAGGDQDLHGQRRSHANMGSERSAQRAKPAFGEDKYAFTFQTSGRFDLTSSGTCTENRDRRLSTRKYVSEENRYANKSVIYLFIFFFVKLYSLKIVAIVFW